MSTMQRKQHFSLDLLGSPKIHRRLTAVLLTILLGTVLFLIFVPWQQSVVGSGRVTSFTPQSRPQTVESAISGRIMRWYVREGDRVAKGDTIVVLADINVNFMDSEMIERMRLLRNRTFAAQEQSIASALQRRKQSEQRYEAARARYDNTKVESETARIRSNRADTLFRQDLIARRELESAQLALQKAVADSASAMAGLLAARQDIEMFSAEEERIINQAYSTMHEMDIRVANAEGRKGAGVVIAPIDGTIVRVERYGEGMMVKEGTPLALIVPAGDDRAVELYVGSMDAALVEPGRLVSLQFSGFPAFQFSGWRNIQVGVFHGRVKVVDATDDGTGRFRILVVPAEGKQFAQWPSNRYLRQGTDASGWVLLDEVSIGYELWRQLMGFPPQYPVAETKSSKAKPASGAKEEK
ncbi:MAG: HlyD family efflux transporter periplasmic adaptor subunit [Candidatus Kapabacteria bacterium]|nr:HlyD family efflux transporter periplasmic adaptor subunit [Candidatus Kapabacteria bacterium]